ncbi:MAG: hypothetical protein QM770_08380 [Tepidisphaeraceae bacterium]
MKRQSKAPDDSGHLTNKREIACEVVVYRDSCSLLHTLWNDFIPPGLADDLSHFGAARNEVYLDVKIRNS